MCVKLNSINYKIRLNRPLHHGDKKIATHIFKFKIQFAAGGKKEITAKLIETCDSLGNVCREIDIPGDFEQCGVKAGSVIEIIESYNKFEVDFILDFVEPWTGPLRNGYSLILDSDEYDSLIRVVKLRQMAMKNINRGEK